MRIEEFDIKQVALEWDGVWFCENCWKAHHWKEKAYVRMVNNSKYCKKCAEEMCTNDSK